LHTQRAVFSPHSTTSNKLSLTSVNPAGRAAGS
jgi:hypothetical protein